MIGSPILTRRVQNIGHHRVYQTRVGGCIGRYHVNQMFLPHLVSSKYQPGYQLLRPASSFLRSNIRRGAIRTWLHRFRPLPLNVLQINPLLVLFPGHRARALHTLAPGHVFRDTFGGNMVASIVARLHDDSFLGQRIFIGVYPKLLNLLLLPRRIVLDGRVSARIVAIIMLVVQVYILLALRRHVDVRLGPQAPHVIATVYLRHDRHLKIVSRATVRRDSLDSTEHPLDSGVGMIVAQAAFGASLLAEEPVAAWQVINIATRENNVSCVARRDWEGTVVKWRLQDTSVEMIVAGWGR